MRHTLREPSGGGWEKFTIILQFSFLGRHCRPGSCQTCLSLSVCLSLFVFPVSLFILLEIGPRHKVRIVIATLKYFQDLIYFFHKLVCFLFAEQVHILRVCPTHLAREYSWPASHVELRANQSQILLFLFIAFDCFKKKLGRKSTQQDKLYIFFQTNKTL